MAKGTTKKPMFGKPAPKPAAAAAGAKSMHRGSKRGGK